MQNYLSDELYSFLFFLLQGMLYAGGYDILRFFRKIIAHNFVTLSVEDVLFWILITILNVRNILFAKNIFFFQIAIIFGAVLYEITFSRFFVKRLLKKIVPLHKIKLLRVGKGGRHAQRR